MLGIRTRRAATVALRVAVPVALLAAAACDVEWGGAELALVDPSPPPVRSDTAAPEKPGEVPLPQGPVLYRIRPGDGDLYRVYPIARLEGEAPRSLDLPDPITERFRARFDSAFLAPGTELAVLTGAARIGTVVLLEPTAVSLANCPSVAPGQLLLRPGDRLETPAFALPREIVPTRPEGAKRPAVDDRIRTFGPILAESILREAGETRPFLAQRAALTAVPYDRDARPAMAATYLINDRLDAPPGSQEAVSLFFLARFEPTRGYVPVWTVVRRYGRTERREAYAWVDAIPGPRARIDILRRYAGATVLLAASPEPREGQPRAISWSESAGCEESSVLGTTREPAQARPGPVENGSSSASAAAPREEPGGGPPAEK